MSDDFILEVDEFFIKEFFGLIDENPGSMRNVTLDDLKIHLVKLKQALSSGKGQKSSIESSNDSNGYGYDSDDDSDEDKKTVLIIDDLGVITYQLNVIMQKYGFKTLVSQEIFDALEKFKNKRFDLVVMDLFIPTEREGLMLLNELQKLIKSHNLETKIIIITASNKKEHKKLCMERGVDIYIEKTGNWQEILCNQCLSL